MNAEGYASAWAGLGYATGRPRVHPLIVERLHGLLSEELGRPATVPWALDVGCGAGLSTAALTAVARGRIGVDPYPEMLAQHDLVAPGASFLVARGEELPLADASMDLVTAAGAVNYTDPGRLLPEVRRVLRRDGVLAIYDFGHGRTSPDAPGLPGWFARYRDRYPPTPGYDMSVPGLDYRGAGLALHSCQEFAVAVHMDQRSYVDYALTGSGVIREVARGAALAEIREWCDATLTPVFAGRTISVDFPAYLAVVVVAEAWAP